MQASIEIGQSDVTVSGSGVLGAEGFPDGGKLGRINAAAIVGNGNGKTVVFQISMYGNGDGVSVRPKAMQDRVFHQELNADFGNDVILRIRFHGKSNLQPVIHSHFLEQHIIFDVFHFLTEGDTVAAFDGVTKPGCQRSNHIINLYLFIDKCPGAGLLGHERAYLAWLDGVFLRYPDLIIENCSSGGLRMDYAMLTRHSIQSTSDQEDYRHYATIAANAPAALTPEQAAIWSYPLADGDAEETIFNMVSAMLLRIHQSGNLADLDPVRRELVKEGIACYKHLRRDIGSALPIWPLGLSSIGEPWVCLGLLLEGKVYIALWKRQAESDVVQLPILAFLGREMKVQFLYPSGEIWHTQTVAWHPRTGQLTVRLPGEYRARLFCLTEKDDNWEGEV